MQSMLEKTESGNPWEALGFGLGTVFGRSLVDSLVDSLTPIQCLKGLFRLKFEGENIFKDALPKDIKSHDKFEHSKPPYQKDSKPAIKVKTEKSPIDDSTNVYLMIDAEKPIFDWLNKEITPILCLRCKENDTDVFFLLGLRPKVEQGSAYLTLRFDNEKAYKEELGISRDGKTVYFRQPISAAKKMMKHKKLLIQVTPHDASSQITTFNLEGLSEKIEPLRKACGW